MHCFSLPGRIRILFALMVLLTAPSFSRAGWKAGDRLPDLASFKLEGALPGVLKGHVVLVDFWASWCAPCKASFPAMEKLETDFRQRGLTILAISVDDQRENMERFVKSAGVSFSILRDANHKLVAAADVQAMPTSFLIDRSGRIRFIHPGFRGDPTVKEYREEIDTLLKEPVP